jgi:hypothetical protein
MDVCHQGNMDIFFDFTDRFSCSAVGQVHRMISQPACSSSFACATEPSISSAGLLSIDWMLIFAPPPIFVLSAVT